jgi:hypothetical protein
LSEKYFTDFEIRAPDQPAGGIVGADLRQTVIAGIKGEESLVTGDPAFDKAVPRPVTTARTSAAALAWRS